MKLISYGNTVICKVVKPKTQMVGMFIIPAKYNDNTELFEIVEFGKLFNNEYSLNIGDKIVISESKENVLIEHDGEKYFICSPSSAIAVFCD